MRYYTPGDFIYVIGFSRGAYTARFLSEMISAVGLLSRGNEEMIRFAYSTFSEAQQSRDKAKPSRKDKEGQEFDPEVGEFRGSPLVEQMLEELFETKNEQCQWRMHLRNLCEEAWLAVLLTRLSRLESIAFDHDGPADLMSTILDKAGLRQRPFHQAVPFPRLQTVALDCNHTCTSGDAGTYSDFSPGLFHLPSVRRIQGERLIECTENMEDARQSDLDGVKNPDCPVREIVLSQAPNCYGMRDWIAACSKLERFEVGIGAMRYGSNDYTFNASRFRECLLPSKETLKTLCIGFDLDYHNHRYHRDDSPDVYISEITDDLPFGSFKAFHVLEHLSMRHPNLVKLPESSSHFQENAHNQEPPSIIDQLPQSLKSLEITEIGWEFVPVLISGLGELIKFRGELMPRLERIGLFFLDEQALKLAKSSIDRLRLVAGRIGVCLTGQVRSIKY
ncbi:hypothetical protein MW887_004325 [Aspergillus wentii]|nr:hypothetical protein MW887_004325 [Aspergillus wentii]